MAEHPDQDEAELLLQEHIDRLNAGEPLDLEGLLRSHPEVGPSVIEQLKVFEGIENNMHPTPPLGTLGDFTLRREIGRGGMGVVYEAWENSMGRPVALKVLPLGVASDERALQRFVREARVAGDIQHPNVVAVFGMGLKEKTPYYAMEYVSGETIAQVIGRLRKFDSETETPFGGQDESGYYTNLAQAFADVADGLQHAHSKGVVHRDIKPSNLIVDAEQRLRILDFGLATLEGQESLTISGDLVGTPAYMSPEQARRRKIPVDHRTDIYSIGATLYELLTHQKPFRGKNHQDTLSQVIERHPRPPRQLNSRIPPDLETIVLKCLEKEPGERYRTAEALGQDLRRFHRKEPIEARPRAAWELWARRIWRHRVSVAALALALVVGVLGLTGGIVLALSALQSTRTQRDEVTRQLYISDIRLAQNEWNAGNIGNTRKLLQRHVPKPDAADLRGWEWYRLRGLLDKNVQTLLGHEAPIYALSWSPDGDRLASASVDGTVRIWNPETAEELWAGTHGPPGHGVRTVHWSPLGDRVATGAADGTVKIWDASTGDELATLAGNESTRFRLECVRWNLDASLLAVSDRRGNLKVWEPASMSVVFEASVPDEYLWSLAWSPDGTTLAGGANMTRLITLWDIEKREVLRSWKAPTHAVTELAWSANGARLASAAGPYVTLWDPTTGARLREFAAHASRTHALAWNGDQIATGGLDGLVNVWDADARDEEDRAPLVKLRGHSAPVRAVAWRPDGEALASAGVDGTIKVWSPVGDQTPPVRQAGVLATWSPDGSQVASRRRELLLFDGHTGEPTGTISFPPGEPIIAKSAAWSPDGSRLAITRRLGQVTMFAWPSAEKLYTIEAHGQIGNPQIVHATRCRTLAWSPDGRLFVTGGFDALVKVWDADSGAAVRKLEGHTDTVGTVLWSPDGTRIASASWDQEVRIWDAGTGRVIHVLRRHPFLSWSDDAQYSLAWSPNSARLASGSAGGALIIWDVVSGEEFVRRTPHIGTLTSVSWSPDGRRLATWGVDGWVKVLDAVTAEELARLPVPRVGGSVAWSPDGLRLAASGQNLRIWDASPGHDFTAEEEE